MPQLDFTTYSSGLKWIVLAASVGYLLFRFVLAAPTWTMTRLQTNDQSAGSVLYSSIIMILTTDYYEIPLFWIRIFDILMFGITGYGIYKVITSVAYKLFPAFAEWWDLSRGARLFAIRLKVEDRLANVFHPGSCQMYLLINLVATYGLNLMCFYVLENSLFFIQATAGFFVLSHCTARTRAVWGYSIPIIYFLIIYLKVKGYIVISDWCPNGQYRFCNGDSNGIDRSASNNTSPKPVGNDTTVSPAPAARSGWRDIVSVAVTQAQESFESNRPGISKTLRAAGENSHAVGAGIWVAAGCVIAASGLAYAGKQVAGAFRGTGKTAAAASQHAATGVYQTSAVKTKPLSVSKPPIGRTELEKTEWEEQNIKIRKLLAEERAVDLEERRRLLAQRRAAAGTTVFERFDGTAVSSKVGPGTKAVSGQITGRNITIAGRFRTGLALGALTTETLSKRENVRAGVTGTSATGSGTAKR